jgi:hypothetical protein
MVGDSTDRALAVTAYLEAHHREGMPLDVNDPPDYGAPVVLPQILTPSAGRKALRDEAGEVRLLVDSTEKSVGSTGYEYSKLRLRSPSMAT